MRAYVYICISTHVGYTPFYECCTCHPIQIDTQIDRSIHGDIARSIGDYSQVGYSWVSGSTRFLSALYFIISA